MFPKDSVWSVEISIHALREEGDQTTTKRCPRFHRFQSTPSARRATNAITEISIALHISIHALREEGDM